MFGTLTAAKVCGTNTTKSAKTQNLSPYIPEVNQFYLEIGAKNLVNQQTEERKMEVEYMDEEYISL